MLVDRLGMRGLLCNGGVGELGLGSGGGRVGRGDGLCSFAGGQTLRMNI